MTQNYHFWLLTRYSQKSIALNVLDSPILVSGCGLACQQEISLVLVKTPSIHYGMINR